MHAHTYIITSRQHQQHPNDNNVRTSLLLGIVVPEAAHRASANRGLVKRRVRVVPRLSRQRSAKSSAASSRCSAPAWCRWECGCTWSWWEAAGHAADASSHLTATASRGVGVVHRLERVLRCLPNSFVRLIASQRIRRPLELQASLHLFVASLERAANVEAAIFGDLLDDQQHLPFHGRFVFLELVVQPIGHLVANRRIPVREFRKLNVDVARCGIFVVGGGLLEQAVHAHFARLSIHCIPRTLKCDDE